MPLSLVNDGGVGRDLVGELFAGHPGERVLTVEPLPCGANSSVCLVSTESGGRYLLKKYRNFSLSDHRDRLSTEFNGLNFLWENGISRIPRPIWLDHHKNIGIYQYIEGRKLLAGEVAVRHLEMAAEFIKELFQLREIAAVAAQPRASEACLCLRSYEETVQKRLDRLLAVPEENKVGLRLRDYLEQEFSPAFRRAKAIFAERVGSLGLDPGMELAENRRVLSPSDFGFHNVIVTDEGRLVFIDFEYYGWDDPAKLIADFYLQPAVPVPVELREHFLLKMDFLVANDPELPKRLPLAYLLSLLKWCLIMLNCFTRYGQEAAGPGQEKLLVRQLALSSSTLQRFEAEMAGGAFPLSLL